MTKEKECCYDCGHNQGIRSTPKKNLRVHCSAQGGWEPYHSRKCQQFKSLTRQSTLDTEPVKII